MRNLLVPVSPGELLDKITILRIKSARMADADKLANVEVELALLEDVWRGSEAASADVADDERALQRVNEKLWDVEDGIRAKEAEGSFDAAFVELARSVYLLNDERAKIKKRINTQLGSEVVEEKSYNDASARPQARRPDGTA